MGNRYFHIESPVLVIYLAFFYIKVDKILYNGVFG